MEFELVTPQDLANKRLDFYSAANWNLVGGFEITGHYPNLEKHIRLTGEHPLACFECDYLVARKRNEKLTVSLYHRGTDPNLDDGFKRVNYILEVIKPDSIEYYTFQADVESEADFAGRLLSTPPAGESE